MKHFLALGLAMAIAACATRERVVIHFIKTPPQVIKQIMLVPVPIPPVPVPDGGPPQKKEDRQKLA